MENKKQQARELRSMIEANIRATRTLIRVDDLSPEELEGMVDLYEVYAIDRSYSKDEIFQFKGLLYKVISDHTSQADWQPDALPALYNAIMPEDVIPEWKQPAGSHDAYSTGDKVIFDGVVYESLKNDNAYSPLEHPPFWKMIEG